MASTYLSRTPSSASNRKKFTISLWCKRVVLGVDQWIIQAGSSGSEFDIRFTTSDQIRFSEYGGGTGYGLITNRVFRDTASWFHLVFTYDSAQATDTNRNKIYVNGEQISASDCTAYVAGKHPPQDNNNPAWNNNVEFRINDVTWTTSSPKDALYTHIHNCDGYAYAASDFGESDSTSGIWKPKAAPSVTHGTNGFFLKFENSGNLDLDSSTNAHTFSTSGTLIQNVDTPTNNFCTLNSVVPSTSANTTISNGGLTITSSGASHKNAISNFGVSTGKWYCEVKVVTLNTHQKIGVTSDDSDELSKESPSEFSGEANGNGYAYRNDGQKEGGGGSISSYGNSYTAGDIIGIAMDLDNNKLYFSKNGTWQNSGDPTSGSSGTGAAFTLTAGKFYLIAINHYNSNTTSFNFGSGYFGTTQVSSAQADDGGLGIMEYDVPANYRVWCTENIKDYG